MSTVRPSRLSRFVRRFARAERGATAVEFAMVSLPLAVLIFGVVELAMVLLVCTTLEGATESAARMIRTGEFQTSAGNTKADFKALVCQRMTWLSSECNADLWIDVRTFSNYGTLAANTPIAAASFGPPPTPDPTCFTAGEPTDIVLVRAYFQWRLFTPLLSAAFEDMGSGTGKRLISTATAFRNEPYNANPPVGARC